MSYMTQSEKQQENYLYLRDRMGSKNLLIAIYLQMSIEEKRATFEYIARVNDFRLPHPESPVINNNDGLADGLKKAFNAKHGTI